MADSHPNPRPCSGRRPRERSPLSGLLVWSVFFVCLIVAAVFIRNNTANVPVSDDWAILVGSDALQTAHADWLWAPHNEHRIPLSKLVLLAAYHASGYSFRAGCWVVLGMLATLAAVMMVLARHLRGFTSWTDIVFPLATLNLAHCENLSWSFQVQFAGSALLPGLLLALMIWRPEGTQKIWELLLIGFLGVSLCGFGVSSIVYAPSLAAWLIYSGWHRGRSGPAQWSLATKLCLVIGIAVTSMTILYFWNLPRPVDQLRVSTLATKLQTSLQFLCLALTPLSQLTYWPAVGGVVLVILLWSASRLVRTFLRSDEERIRCAALLAMLAGLLLLAIGIGWGRAALKEGAGFSLRYVTLALPAIYLSYFVALLYGSPKAGRVGQIVLALIPLFLYWPHYRLGNSWVATRVIIAQDFERDLQAGMRTAILADKHTDPRNSRVGGRIYPHALWVADQTLQLRSRSAGPFQPTVRDGESRMEKPSLDAATGQSLDWRATDRAGSVTRQPGRLTIPLSQATYLQRVYLTILVNSPAGSSCPFTVRCSRAGQSKLTVWSSALRIGPEPNYLVAAIDDEVTGLEFEWSNSPIEFRILDFRIMSGKPALADSRREPE